jgi:hypothetical protein
MRAAFLLFDINLVNPGSESALFLVLLKLHVDCGPVLSYLDLLNSLAQLIEIIELISSVSHEVFTLHSM